MGTDTLWQPDAARIRELEPERPVLSRRARIRPPRGYALREVEFVRDPVAAFVDGPNRLEIQMLNGVPGRVTFQEFTATTRKMHKTVSELNDVEVGRIENGAIHGVPFARFLYSGKSDDGRSITGSYWVARPRASGPIWNVVAEGTREAFPTLEASALTFRIAE